MRSPDLANQIVGLITRFREEPVAVIDDIESMFDQVLVPEKDRSLLRSCGGKILTPAGRY